MTDQMLPADKVRNIAAEMRDAMRREEDGYLYADFLSDMSDYIRELEALLPPRPTLADMSMKERAACQWMQADVKGEESRVVIITHDFSGGCAALLDQWGNVTYEGHAQITPQPDLRRLEWPGDKKDEPAPATLTEGSEWGDIHALTTACRESGRDQIVVIDCEGDVSVWDADAEWWAPVTPVDGYEPYTIIHTGREADQ